MRCMGCIQTFAKKYIAFCHGCKAWYCRDCMKDHGPCYETEFKSVWHKLEDFYYDPEPTFDESLFREFQVNAGCIHTQQKATQLWKKVKDFLTKDERNVIMDAWIMVSDSYREEPVVGDCVIDQVCNEVIDKRLVLV